MQEVLGIDSHFIITHTLMNLLLMPPTGVGTEETDKGSQMSVLTLRPGESHGLERETNLKTVLIK